MKRESSDPSNSIVQSLLRRKLVEMDDERCILILIQCITGSVSQCITGNHSNHLF